MVGMLQTEEDRTNAVFGLAVGVLGPIVVALVLVPFRSDLHNANLALILVLVVVLAAIIGGRRAGAARGDRRHALVRLLPDPSRTSRSRSRRSDDLETALILLGVGLLVGAVASRGRRSERGRERAGEAISRVHRVADLIARGTPIDDVVTAVTRRAPGAAAAPGLLAGVPAVRLRDADASSGAATSRDPSTAGSAVGSRSRRTGSSSPCSSRARRSPRFVLIGDPTAAVTIEERVVAVALADQLGVALALAGPDEQARLAKESRQE